MVLLTCALILLVGLSPAVAGWWLVYRADGARRYRRAPRATPYPLRQRMPPLPPADPERRHIRGVGDIIGDISCRFNARSGALRCAVNPMGPCRGCSLYKSVKIPPLDSGPGEEG